MLEATVQAGGVLPRVLRPGVGVLLHVRLQVCRWNLWRHARLLLELDGAVQVCGLHGLSVLNDDRNRHLLPPFGDRHGGVLGWPEDCRDGRGVGWLWPLEVLLPLRLGPRDVGILLQGPGARPEAKLSRRLDVARHNSEIPVVFSAHSLQNLEGVFLAEFLALNKALNLVQNHLLLLTQAKGLDRRGTPSVLSCDHHFGGEKVLDRRS